MIPADSYFGKMGRLYELRDTTSSLIFRVLNRLGPTKRCVTLLAELKELEAWKAQLPATVKFRRYQPFAQEVTSRTK